MSNLEELKNTVENPLLLLKEIKNSGVEFRKIRETCIIKSGEFASPKELSKIQDDLHIYPCYGSNGLRGYINKFNYDGEYSIVGRVGACGAVNYINGKYFITDNAFIVKSKNGEYIPKFLYYLLISLNLNKYKLGGAQPAISGKIIYDLNVPIPPLDIQEEIVRILDPLTKDVNELIDLLKKEQELRKKQYSYYRDKLLTFDEYTPKIKLGEVCEKIKNINWKKENNISKKYIDLSSVSREFHEIIDNEVKEVNSENAPSRARQIIKINDILFGTTRPMLKRYCIVPEKYDDQICSTGFCVLRIVNKDVLVNFIYHCLSTSNFYNFIEDNEQGTTYPAISDNILKEYKIPLPPIEKQKEIVTILDSLEKYYNNLQKSLPSEIEKRKKQYEFYRDKLLTF